MNSYTFTLRNINHCTTHHQHNIFQPFSSFYNPFDSLGSSQKEQTSAAIVFFLLQILHCHLSLSLSLPIFIPPLVGILYYSSSFLGGYFYFYFLICCLVGLRSWVPFLLPPPFVFIIKALIIITINQALAFILILRVEVMLNPIRNLSGKLNHFHIRQTRYFRIIELANSLRLAPQPAQTFAQATLESILALKSNTNTLNPRDFHKFQFDYQVHSQSAIYSAPSTLLDDLGPFQKKISLVVASYANKLNSRQLFYLNLALIKRLSSKFPGWNTLHLSQISPSKIDLQVLPCLNSTSRVQELKAQPKKVVMKNIVLAKSTSS